MQLIVTITNEKEIDHFPSADGFIYVFRDLGIRSNSEEADLAKMINKIHAQNKTIYLFINKIFLQSEIKKLEENIEFLATFSIDGLLFSDFAVYELAKKYNIVDKLIYASETQLVNYQDLNTLHKQGVDSFIISKEMTYNNLLLSAKNTSAKLGMLIFGHYQMFYSKRKLLSNFFAQYDLEHKEKESIDFSIKEKSRDGRYPIVENSNGSSIFSHDVMCGIEEFNSLVDHGFHYFIFDSLFLDKDLVNKVIEMFKESNKTKKSYRVEDIKEVTKLENLTKGFLYRELDLK